MYIFVKEHLSTFHPILEKCKHAGKRTSKNQKYFQTPGFKSLAHKIRPVKETKIRGNIWSYTVGGRSRCTGHPAPFPKQLLIDHIFSWTNELDLVFDPFAGSGTTLEAAKEMNRFYLGCEISQEYCEVIKKRLQG
jgi:site-specific DNA-methyltransferase (adenine-specific)